MCTLSWVFEHQDYRVYFNRDESRERQTAIPPRVHKKQMGVEFIAPIDAEAGGSWIAVNQYGLSVCLLNYYQGSEPVDSASKLTRGAIVISLIGSMNFDELEQRLNKLELTVFAGFTLVVFQKGAVKGWQWDGDTLQAIAPTPPLISSLLHKDVVLAKRKHYFERLPDLHPKTLEAFHSSHFENEVRQESGELLAECSVCMHRDNAQTVSLSVIEVNSECVSMTYTQGSPCSSRADSPVVLMRCR